MLEKHLSSPITRRRLRTGPAADHIDAFADLTHDHYFIHVDRARAAATRFGGTIAHGFLTLSMLAPMAYQACPAVQGTKTAVNYGFDRLRFVTPVPSGARIRGRFVLNSFDVQASGRWQAAPTRAGKRRRSASGRTKTART